MKSNISDPWSMEDLQRILKKLKNNKTRDPSGYLNEVFKPGVIGRDLANGLLNFINGTKSSLYIPEMLRLANISTIYKNKGSRQDLKNDRGIFGLSVLRSITDKMVYEDMYPDIEESMSDSNIGARRHKNVRNHLFVIHGIVNSVVHGEDDCVDIQIYDLVQAFDALWLDDCMNDIFDAVSENQRNDKLALLYQMNTENKVAVNTAVGQTERVTVNKVVTQGGTWGPMMCSCHIDTLGQMCQKSGENLYMYKKLVNVLPLAMVDDLLGVAKCGLLSIRMNTFINTNIELKKLEFHTPGPDGKSKCHVMHVGKKNSLCPDLQVHGTLMQKVSHDTYLGDVISADGSNTLNIKNRVSIGLGAISQIENMLSKITLGNHYFKTAVLLRESLFLSKILPNSEAWYGLKKNEIEELESLDKMLIRSILKTPLSTPSEALQLELGLISISTLIKARRINFLHYLVTCKDSEMIHKFFMAQWDYPTRNDWTIQVRDDLEEFGISANLEAIKSKSPIYFKKLVKIKASEFEYEKLQKIMLSHSKMDNLRYSKLEMQNYFKLENCTADMAKLMFKFRCRMADFDENFRGGLGPRPCQLCGLHLDNQETSFQCPEITKQLEIKVEYSKIFQNIIPAEIFETISRITAIRDAIKNGTN
jgi:hypothetical protein